MLGLNPNAADQISFMLDILATANNNLITIGNGVQELITVLYDKVTASGRSRVVLGTGVTSYSELAEGTLHVTTTTDETFTADALIFTCQQRAYANITGFPAPVRELISSVLVVELFKVLLCSKLLTSNRLTYAVL